MDFVCTSPFPHDDYAYGSDEPPEGSDLSETQMPRGLPRPRDAHGTPVPYIARSPDELGLTSAMRQLLCVVDRRCQVCGDPLGDRAVVVARPGDALVIDGAAIHPDRCWPMARRLCPALVRLADEGTLRVWEVDTGDLEYRRAGRSVKLEGYAPPDGPGEPA